DGSGNDRQLDVTHDLDDGGDRLAPKAVAVAAYPVRTRGAQQNLLESGDGERRDVSKRFTVERALERVAEAVVHEVAGNDLSQGLRTQRAARFETDFIVERTANEQVAFLELIGESKCRSQIRRVHSGRTLDRYHPACWVSR